MTDRTHRQFVNFNNAGHDGLLHELAGSVHRVWLPTTSLNPIKADPKGVYTLIHERLVQKSQVENCADIASFCVGATELPDAIAERVDRYLQRGDEQSLIDLALSIVRTYLLSGVFPEGHLELVAFLLWTKRIRAEEACDLAQLDASNFPLMTEPARAVVRRAEVIAEEQRLGFMSAGEDNALETCLLAFCQERDCRS